MSGQPEQRPERDPSPILAMHARYERAFEEYNAIDKESSTTPDNSQYAGFKLRYREAMKASEAETNTLRTAILYQVPDSWRDALVLAFHVNGMTDMQSNAEITEDERKALAVGIETLFDFMCCEVDQDHEALGKQFQSGACLAFTSRRYRTGRVDD